jgi:hypothetical protein
MGPLRNKMVACINQLFEHGLVQFWTAVEDSIGSVLVQNNARNHGRGIQQDDVTPVSLDFEIMNIFSLCGYLLAFSVIAFLAEFACKFLNGIKLVWLEILAVT